MNHHCACVNHEGNSEKTSNSRQFILLSSYSKTKSKTMQHNVQMEKVRFKIVNCKPHGSREQNDIESLPIYLSVLEILG